AAVHQGYIEPHACVVRVDADGQTDVWSSSQGHFVVRALTAKLLNKPVGDVRCSPAEIGGGFGGKTVVYLEPVAALLSQKSARPARRSRPSRSRASSTCWPRRSAWTRPSCAARTPPGLVRR